MIPEVAIQINAVSAGNENESSFRIGISDIACGSFPAILAIG